MKISVVVGAHYGDEGKGLVTNWLSKKDDIVIRYNGGAQAGHTVITEDNKRHVFSHLGSGTFKGARTHFSRDFILNPMLFQRENKNPLISTNKLSASFYCMVATPWDMIINQAVEEHRTIKHGSCGTGIFETIERNKKVPFIYNYMTLYDKSTHTYSIHNSTFTSILKNIKDYFKSRLEFYGIDKNTIQELVDTYFCTQFIDDFTENCSYMLSQIQPINDDFIKQVFNKNIIFEGAQGLLLDQNYIGLTPHLTPSNTGSTNPLKLIDHIEQEVDIYYVTRCYVTRHGNGHFHREISKEIIGNIDEKTNLNNKWQGAFRYGYFDFDIFKRAIEVDQINHKNRKINYNIVVTCCDQLVNSKVTFFINGAMYRRSYLQFLNILSNEFKGFKIYYSTGPKASDIHSYI